MHNVPVNPLRSRGRECSPRDAARPVSAVLAGVDQGASIRESSIPQVAGIAERTRQRETAGGRRARPGSGFPASTRRTAGVLRSLLAFRPFLLPPSKRAMHAMSKVGGEPRRRLLAVRCREPRCRTGNRTRPRPLMRTAASTAVRGYASDAARLRFQAQTYRQSLIIPGVGPWRTKGTRQFPEMAGFHVRRG